jgi:integrase
MKLPKAKKLPSGSWFIRLRLSGEEICITETTEKKAIDQARLVKAEYKAGVRQARDKDTRTVRKICEAYIESRRKKLRSPATIRGYDKIMRTRFQSVMDKPVTEVKDWEKVVMDELKTKVQSRKKLKPGEPEPECKNVSRKTVKNAWGFVSSALKAAKIAVPEIAIDDADRAERPWLDYEQINDFLKAVKGQPCELGALLALHALRRSELYALRWADIDLRREVIHVRGAVVHDDSGKLVRKNESKTKDSRRDVPILIPRLTELLKSMEQDNRPVVEGSVNTLYNRIRSICEKNGLPNVGVHGLRHSFASLAYHVGMGELETMQLGGWSDPDTMRKIYRHLSAQDKNAAAAKMAAFYSAIQNGNENGNESKKP